MSALKKSIRQWWKKPQNVTERNLDREITQLELFYDLIYVAIIIQLTHLVAGHISFESLFQYFSIFLMMLWAWFNGSMYHELHGNNDMKTRLFTFMQMLCLAGMGIFIPSAFSDTGYQGFALSYGVFLALLTFLWWRTGVHDSDHKPISTPYVWIFIITTIAFFISLFLPNKEAHYLWFGAIVFAWMFSSWRIMFPSKKAKKEQLEAVRDIGESFVERLGLLTIIILGEGILSIIKGASHITHWYTVNIFTVVACFGIIIGIWWIFFDFISRRMPHKKTQNLWLFLHFPLWLSIGLINAGILNAIEYSSHLIGPDRWIITIPLMVFLSCCMILGDIVEMPERVKNGYDKATIVMGCSIILLGFINFLPTGKTTTLGLITIIFMLPIVTMFFYWAKKLYLIEKERK